MRKYDNVLRISPENATIMLRKRILAYGGRLRHLHDAAWFAWLGARLALKGFLVLLASSLIFYTVLGSMVLADYAVIAGFVLLMASAFLEITGRYGKFWQGSRGILIGRSFAHYTEPVGGDAAAVGSEKVHRIDYSGQPNHHVLINGSTSSGKTVTMLTLAARASLQDRINFLMIDWNGENEAWAKKVGASVWKVPENFKINLFKLNGMGKESRASMATESLMIAARLTSLQATRVKSALLKLYSLDGEPSLSQLWEDLCSNKASKANVLDRRLRAIQRVIGYEPEEFWNGIFSGNSLISLSGLNESEKSLVVYSIMQRISELFDKNPEMNAKLRLMVILDEAWQFFRREREFGTRRESSLEKVVRLGRKYGFGLVVSTQQIEDVPKVFINSCALLMLHQQREYEYYGRNIIGLGRYEESYLKAAGQGEMLLFDRGMAQKGQLWPEYVKVSPLSDAEATALALKFSAHIPKTILEPQMPIEMHADMHAQETRTPALLAGLDIPSVAVYRFMIAIHRTGNLTKAYEMLREKGWLTSLASLYGGKSKPSILARAASFGYVSQEGSLTEKGLKVVDPERLIAKQGIYSGSEEHKELMRRTIRMIQDGGNFAFTLSDKDSFDVGELKAKMKRIWDYERLVIYECQTNAIGEEIIKCAERAKNLGAGMVFVVNNYDIAKAIEKVSDYKYVVL